MSSSNVPAGESHYHHLPNIVFCRGIITWVTMVLLCLPSTYADPIQTPSTSPTETTESDEWGQQPNSVRKADRRVVTTVSSPGSSSLAQQRLEAVRTAYSKVCAAQSNSLVQQQLQTKLQGMLDSCLVKYANDPEVHEELLRLQCRLHADLNQPQAVKIDVAKLYELYEKKYQERAPQEWMKGIVQDWRQHPHLNPLAVTCLEQVIPHMDSREAAKAHLMVGEIWTQISERSGGSFEQAITEYASIEERYKNDCSDLADIARFRRAKLLYCIGEQDEGMRILYELKKHGRYPILLEARVLYLQIESQALAPDILRSTLLNNQEVD
ncbi:MAG: hypothetical protein HJJLKODD_02709 [Phycisphaerae bacterium]|nr:hypothetical protein [Phycisphaerae bacterium]